MIKRQNGSILIASVWIMSVMSVLAVGLGFRSSIEARLSAYGMNAMKAGYIAKAGIVKAADLLSKDDNDYDTIYECGVKYAFNDTPESVFGPSDNVVTDGSFSVYYPDGEGNPFYGMSDEERRININIDITAPGNPAEFKKILQKISPDMPEAVINAIIDWQDPDSGVSIPGGAEDDYYQGLKYPYNCKNKKIDYPEELLLIKGMTQELYDSLKDYITVYGDGKINMNTAPEKVLSAVIDDKGGTYKLLVNKIVAYRNGPDTRPGTKDDWALFSLDDVRAKIAANEIELSRLALLADRLVFGSNNFRVISHCRLNRTDAAVTAVIDRAKGEIKYYHEE